MASEPIGLGEEKHPSSGNAMLTTCALDGTLIQTPLWIVQFATDLNLQVDSAQLRRGYVHRPVRFSERFLTFTTIWNVADRPKYLKLGERIRQHWARNFNEDRPTPMIFKYYGASKAWKGYIENWETAFALTDVILSYTFNMRIALTPDKAYGNNAEIASVAETNVPYAPTAGQVKDYGKEWYTGVYFEGQMKKAAAKTTKKKGSGRGDATKEASETIETATTAATAETAARLRRASAVSADDANAGADELSETVDAATETAASTAGAQFKYIERYLRWEVPTSKDYFYIGGKPDASSETGATQGKKSPGSVPPTSSIDGQDVT